jgi:hexosaminidase
VLVYDIHFNIFIIVKNYSMKNSIFFKRARTFICSGIIFTLISCSDKQPSDLTRAGIIPLPVSVTATGEYFIIKPNTTIYYSSVQAETGKTGEYLKERIKPVTALDLKVKNVDKEPARGIYLALIPDIVENREEGYVLEITRKRIKLTASEPAGLFRGAQTLMQILPAGMDSLAAEVKKTAIPTGSITDYPRYSYRGAMLDVSRHFFGPDDVKRYIDLISYYKMNALHLHLSDDQGWRIEIKSWPGLAIHGGSTQVGGGPGGFYTQEQYSGIVKYAAERFIMIVPEIDMPGHTNAALASYDVLNCSGKATELYTGTSVGFSSLCTRKDTTYKFIDDVIGELAALTPGPYFHIGGDESLSTKREDYIYFINKVQEIVVSHGKQVLGWDDISITTLKPGSVVQHWASEENAIKGAGQGAKVIMSPAGRTYLDMKYDSLTSLGLNWAGYIEVDKGYSWDPETLIPGLDPDKILGIEGPLWSETVTKMDDIEYMAFPRLPGLAEIGWTAASQRNWDDYRVRLGKHGKRFSASGIDYYASPLVEWE